MGTREALLLGCFIRSAATIPGKGSLPCEPPQWGRVRVTCTKCVFTWLLVRALHLFLFGSPSDQTDLCLNVLKFKPLHMTWGVTCGPCKPLADGPFLKFSLARFPFVCISLPRIIKTSCNICMAPVGVYFATWRTCDLADFSRHTSSDIQTNIL